MAIGAAPGDVLRMIVREAIIMAIRRRRDRCGGGPRAPWRASQSAVRAPTRRPPQADRRDRSSGIGECRRQLHFSPPRLKDRSGCCAPV